MLLPVDDEDPDLTYKDFERAKKLGKGWREIFNIDWKQPKELYGLVLEQHDDDGIGQFACTRPLSHSWYNSTCGDNEHLPHVCFGPQGRKRTANAYCAESSMQCPILDVDIFNLEKDEIASEYFTEK